MPCADLLEEILDLTAEDAEHFGCVAEVTRVRDILGRGTSAHRQVAIHRESLEAGADGWEALHRVVDWLVEETVLGVPV